MESIQDFYSMWIPHGMRGHGKVLKLIQVEDMYTINFVSDCRWMPLSPDLACTVREKGGRISCISMDIYEEIRFN